MGKINLECLRPFLTGLFRAPRIYGKFECFPVSKVIFDINNII